MIVSIPAEAVMRINPLLLIVGYFVCCIAGTIIFNRSDNPLISFIGYNMVVIPIGIIITPFVQSFDPEIVKDAVMATGLVTVVMMILRCTPHSSLELPKASLSHSSQSLLWSF
jgi:hypothetical protein